VIKVRRDRRTGGHGNARRISLAAIVGILLAVITVLEVWATPPGWLLPARQRTVGVLHWASTSWLGAAASLSATAAIAGLLVPFLLRWLDRRHPLSMAGQERDAQQRAIMLRRVRYKWITGVLEPSLARAAHLILGMERRPDLLGLGARTVYRPGSRAEPLPTDMPISKFFDMVGGGMLIVGAPGGGKTTTLLQLCRELLDRAEYDSGWPIPVVVNLASWGRHRLPLGAWLVDELADGYQVPRRVAAAWVEQDALTLLLDGLDEVADTHRVACADAINAWRHKHGLVPVVVSGRTEELQALGPRLRLEEAVELQPPSDAEVDRYLGYLEATGTPIGEVRDAIAADGALRRLVNSPLLLHVVVLAYHGRPASALHALGTVQQRQAWLWEAYVARMFEQRPLDPADGYTDEMALGWLAWLARSLQERAQTEFNLDRLAPEWLPTAAKQRRVLAAIGLATGLVIGPVLGLGYGLIAGAFGLSFGLISGLGFGLVAGLTLGLVAGIFSALSIGPTVGVEPDRQQHRSRFGFLGELIRRLPLGLRDRGAVPDRNIRPSVPIAWLAVPFGLTTGLTAGLTGGWVGGLALGLYTASTFGLAGGLSSPVAGVLSGGLASRMEPTEEMRWSWPRLRAGLPRALLGGLVGALVFGPVFGLVAGPAAGLVFAPVFGLIAGLLGALAAGLSRGLRDERTMPNEGIRRSAQYALAAGLIAGLSAGLISGLASGLAFGTHAGIAAGLGFALSFAPAPIVMFGGDACLQHYLVRAWLAGGRAAPWRYPRFLEAMAQRLLLRRSGSAFLFIHRLLRDYLADL
jgi:eukaryotic-like serine/threonine-protein kinase